MPITVKITPEDFLRCEKFAYSQLETSSESEYRRRGGDPSKFRHQIVVGKLAEIAVGKHIGIEPDFATYEREDKDFSPDMVRGKTRFHVKGQDIAQSKKYGHSWLFQRWDDVVTSPTVYDMIVPCTVSESVVQIWGVIPALSVKWGVPKAPIMAATKVALYLEDNRSGLGLDSTEV